MLSLPLCASRLDLVDCALSAALGVNLAQRWVDAPWSLGLGDVTFDLHVVGA